MVNWGESIQSGYIVSVYSFKLISIDWVYAAYLKCKVFGLFGTGLLRSFIWTVHMEDTSFV